MPYVPHDGLPLLLWAAMDGELTTIIAILGKESAVRRRDIPIAALSQISWSSMWLDDLKMMHAKV